MNWGSKIDTDKSIKKRKLSFTTTLVDDLINYAFPIIITLAIILLTVGILQIINDTESAINILKLIIVDLVLVAFFAFYLKKMTTINKLESVAIKSKNKLELQDIRKVLDKLGWITILTKEPLIYARNYRGWLLGGQEIAIIRLDKEILFNSTSVPVTSTNVGQIRFPISLWSNRKNFREFMSELNELINEK